MAYPESGLYEVDRILEKRFSQDLNCDEYLIRWKGYGSDEDSWEPLNCLIDCNEALAEFTAKCLAEEQQKLRNATVRSNRRTKREKNEQRKKSTPTVSKTKKSKSVSPANDSCDIYTDIIIPQQITIPASAPSTSTLKFLDYTIEDDGAFFRIMDTVTGNIIRATIDEARERAELCSVLLEYFESQIIPVAPSCEVKLFLIPSIIKSEPCDFAVSDAGDQAPLSVSPTLSLPLSPSK